MTTTEVEWRHWVKDLGFRVRRLRELVGLTQLQLARAAGVSQGGVSRFEAGRGLATPLLVAVKLSAALAGTLRTLDRDLLSAEARDYLDRTDYIAVPKFKGVPATIFSDARVEETMRTLARMTPERREVAATVMLAAVRAVDRTAGSSEPEAGPVSDGGRRG
jgi:transcriptional regulator with XRE-family HTH domain